MIWLGTWQSELVCNISDDLVGLSNLNVLNIVTLDSVSTVLGPSIAVEVVGAGVVLNGEVDVVITDVFASTSAT
jgi:hypothetical protein